MCGGFRVRRSAWTPHFGGDGRVSTGFTPVDGHETDHAVVACASGSRLLVSLAGLRWLAGGDGGAYRERRAGYPVQRGRQGDLQSDACWLRVGDAPAVGACLADGSPVLAYGAVLTATESALVVIKLDPATGLLTPTSASNILFIVSTLIRELINQLC